MKTWILALTFALLLPFAGQAQLLNGDFEDLNDTLPAHWSMYDFGTGLTTSYVQSGTYGLAVWNWYYYARGYVVNGTNPSSLFTDMPGNGTPATEKALRLTGYYYYDTTGTDTNADTAIIAVAYRKWDATNSVYDTVAFGMQYMLPTSGSDMVPFSIPIADWAPGVDPDTVLVVLISSINGFCDASAGGNCLYLYVDDMKLENTTGVQHIGNQFEPLNLRPNPACNTITLNAEKEGSLWQLFDLSGKLVQSQTLHQGENSLDVSAHPAGLYFVELTHNGTVLGREKLVKQ